MVLIGCVAALADETQVSYLSGQGKDDPVTWEFFCTAGRNSGKWAAIGVPSNWELQGFGNYNYGNDKKKADEQGKYRRTFSVPANWGDKRIFLVFDGVMTDTEVSINGKSAGPRHQGGFYRFKYEIADLVKAGENLLEVTVSKVSSDASVEDAERGADYWVFGGIYRRSIWRRCRSSSSSGPRWTPVRMGPSAWMFISTEPAVLMPLRRQLSGRTALCWVKYSSEVGPGLEKATLRTQVRGHKLWTAETPNLYTVRVDLWRGRRKPTQSRNDSAFARSRSVQAMGCT